MKNIKYLVLTVLTVFAFISCVDDDNDELTGNAITGGLVSVNNALISYVVGSGNTYSASGSVYQGNVQVTSINIYKSFQTVGGDKSDEVFFTSVDLPAVIGQTSNFSLSFTYEDLIDGLTLNGSALPANDGELSIGDFWTLRYASNTSTGSLNFNGSVTKIAVGTRYAGVYSTEEAAYWNSGSYLGSWAPADRIIESVDATVYKHVGHAYWDDQEWFFTVDNETGYITVLPEYPAGTGTLINGSPIMTCEGAGGDFEMITCDATTSKATPDDVNGEDMLEFTVGYFRGVGATREFYEKLIKQVD
ncbi:hypothetical protein V8G56_04935 [Gaetbulibacter aquiaggeris]|uniref:Lipoprotein n=1 Tax=Gaetbulibacter aquiaggeris TaxID=1735373 RepID=A0ABW7MN59_9FLAO